MSRTYLTRADYEETRQDFEAERLRRWGQVKVSPAYTWLPGEFTRCPSPRRHNGRGQRRGFVAVEAGSPVPSTFWKKQRVPATPFFSGARTD